MATLNKQKPYGTVCGTGFPYHFEQNGKFFNQAGLEVNEKGELITEPPELENDHVEPDIGPDVEPEDDGIDDFTANELREQLDRLEVKYRANDSKPGLRAMLREELAARKNEDDE